MSEYKYQNGSIGKAFYYLSPDSTEIYGGLDEEKILELTPHTIKEYVVEAIEYWKQNNYFEKSYTSVFVFRGGNNNTGVIFVRFDPSATSYYNQVSTVHISRFIVEFKGSGFGSKMISWFKQFNRKITLWSNEEAVSFYERNGFVFDFNRYNEIDGHKYTWGEWNK